MEHQKVNQKENRQEHRKENRKEHRADRLLFRKATQADEGQVYALICDMEQKELPREAFAAIFARQLEDEHYCCLVCELDQPESGQSGQQPDRQPELAGVLNLRLEDQLHHAGRIAEIMEFAVAASCRSGGLGRLLFARACDLAREQGCTQIEVACNQLRTRTHGFYLKQGMHNFHFKFSKSLTGTDADAGENRLGR